MPINSSQEAEALIKRWKNQNLSDYNVKAMEYPDGLRVKEDLQNYVAFYINTRDKASNGIQNNPAEHYLSEDQQKIVNQLNNSGTKITQDAIAATGKTIYDNVELVTAAAATATAIGMGVKIKNIPAALLTGVAATLGVSLSKESIASLPLFSNGSTSRLKNVITLHISEKPVVSYGVNYANKDLGALAGLLLQGSAFESLEAAATNPEVQSRIIAELAKIPSLKSGGGVISDLIELGSRQKTNPFREVLFESVDYRTFQFSYRFLPKTESETKKIQSIISTFKENMHPEITQQKLFYIYPSEFDIKYFYKNKENKYLHKFARCALTDMVVDYGGDQFVTFNDGAPVEIGMTLKFQELEQMTSEGIKNYGY